MDDQITDYAQHLADKARIKELEAALKGQKMKVAILNNMVKQRDKQVDGLILRERKLAAESDRYREALDKIHAQCHCPTCTRSRCHGGCVAAATIAREAREGKP